MTNHTDNVDSPRTLKTSTTTLRVVNALKELNGGTVTEMAEHLGLSKGGVYNHLATLKENEFVIKKGNVYDLSPQFILLGEHVRQKNLLYEFGKQEVDELVEETGEYAQLITERHGLGFVLYLRRGQKALRSNYPNQMKRKPLNLHHLAAGKAILARLPDTRVREIIDRHGLNKRTENTITQTDSLLEQLAEISERGYAYNIEEEVEGLRAIGAAINDADGNVIGAISLSGPKSRMQGGQFRNELPKKVMNTADIIEVNINMMTQSDNF